MTCIIIEDQPPAQRILKKYIDDMVENTDSNNSQSGGPANNVRSHVDMAEQEENRLLLSSAIPDNLSLDPIM